MIKTFKDFVESDLNVFFNLNEFGEEHVLDGLILTLIVVDVANDELNGFSQNQMYASQEVFKHRKVIYVKSADYFVPKVDSKITLDGVEFYVDEADESLGVIKISISSIEV